MYGSLVVIGLILTVIVIAVHRMKVAKVSADLVGGVQETGSGFGLLLKKLIKIAVCACFVILAITGFGPAVFSSEPIHGVMLMLHATVAPVFAVAMVALAVIAAHRNRIDEKDCSALGITCSCSCAASDTKPAGGCTRLGRKLCFWIMMAMAVPTMLSMVLSMLPLYGTHGQETLLSIHKYSTLLLVMAGGLYAYLSVASKLLGDD